MKPQHRAQRLQPVQRVAEQREQEAERRLAAAVGALREAEAVCRQLAEHRARCAPQPGAEARFDVAVWQDQQAFMARLDQAIRAQHDVLADRRLAVQAMRRAWQSAHGRVAALARLHERLVREAGIARDRALQSDLDERAQRARGTGRFGLNG